MLLTFPNPNYPSRKSPTTRIHHGDPILTHKYNAQIPLGYIYSDADIDESPCIRSSLLWTVTDILSETIHPLPL